MDTVDMTADLQWQSSKPDDLALVRAIVPMWRDSVGFLHREWYRYERGCWRSRAREQIQAGIADLLEDIRSEHRLDIGINQARVEGITKMLQTRLFVSDDDFMAHQPEQDKYINLRNGLFNLQTFELEPHQADLKFTTQLDFDYDVKADHPVWDRYLLTSLVDDKGRGDLELIYLLQEALAYSMTARTDLKASFWCVGSPDSGKSTLLSFIKSLMGSFHTTIDLNQLADNRFILSGIPGKRVVTFGEADESAVLPDALYKTMVGGVDEIYTDVKNKPGISFKPIAKFWWGMNGAPRMKDRSGALLNRLKVIPFIRSVPVEKRNIHLSYQLTQERSGIFNWIMAGYRRLLKEGKFTVAEQSEAWRENYKLENDTEQTFINERCQRVPGAQTQSEQLYAQYTLWCREGGFKPKNRNQIAKDWERLGFQRLRLSDANYWVGVHLNDIKLDLK